MSHRDLVVELQAPADLAGADLDAFDYRCGVARADAIDRILMRVVEERGWTLFDEGVVDRVTVEHDGPTRARIVIDGTPATTWWQDRMRTSGGVRRWSYEPEAPSDP